MRDPSPDTTRGGATGGVLLRLLGRGIRYRFLRATGSPARIEALSLEVTRRCIARCVMCNIWRASPERPELDAGDWLRLLGSPALHGVRELDVTGGEPFLRGDLVQLLAGIAALRGAHLPDLRSVAVTTNGLLTAKVLEDVGAVVGPLEAAGVHLVLALGMDAASEVHDRIRNVEGAWSRLDATIRGLCRVRETHPGLVLGVKTTVTRYNVHELEPISRYADELGLFIIISPYILTANRYGNLDRQDALALSPGDVEQLKAFYRSSGFRWSYYRRELLRFLETGRMEKPCSAGFNYFFIRSTGELHPCPIADQPLGDVRETPIQDLVRSAKAARFRRRVRRLPECASCTEPGLERYALPFEGFHYLRQRLLLGGEGFRALHGHLGLAKYF